MKDSEFINYFMAVLGVLIAITAMLLVLANSLASHQQTTDVAMIKSTNERIAPIGQVNIGNVPTPKAPAMDDGSEATAIAFNPEGVYQSVCSSCHNTGVLESPRIDDAAEWTKRLAAGLDTVYQNAIQGIGNMPAKGGRTDLPDENFKKIIDYMLAQAGVSP